MQSEATNETATQPSARVTRGILAGFTEHGEPLVDFPGNPTGKPLPAISTITLRYEFGGREAVLMFEDGDATRPVLIGLVQPPLKPGKQIILEEGGGPLEAVADGETVRINGHKEIVLRCGLASITLTRDGKILLRGAYVQSRSSGVNRIKGASVQIN
jgi:Domain of unknown function (DUF6484)